MNIVFPWSRLSRVMLAGVMVTLWPGAALTASGDRAPEQTRLRRGVEEAERQFGAESRVTAAALTQLGELEQATGRDREAEAALSKAAAILEKRLGAHHPEVAEAQTRLARARLRLGRFQEARRLLEGVVAALERSLGADHLNSASARVNLARLLMAEPEQREKAARLLESALPVLAKGLWPDHPRVAEAWMVLSRIRFALGRADEAQEAVGKALRIREETLGGEHPLVAESLREQGHQWAARGRMSLGEPLLRRAVAILEKTGESAPLELAESLESLAEGLIGAERRTEAEPILQRALQWRERALDREHPSLVKVLNDLALLRLAAQDPTGAETLFRRSLAVSEKRMGKDHLQGAFIEGNLSQIAARQGRVAESERLFTHSIATAERYFQGNPLGLSDWLANLGVILHQEGAGERAILLLRKAEGLLIAAHGADHPQVARVSRAIRELGQSGAKRIETETTESPAGGEPIRPDAPTRPVAVAAGNATIPLETFRQTYVITPATIVPLESAGGGVSAVVPDTVPVVTVGAGRAPLPVVHKEVAPEGGGGIRQGSVVHLSCYAPESPHVALLEEKMHALSLPVYHKPIKNGATIFSCVFVGPYATRPEAEAVAGRIRTEAGVSNPIVGRYQRGE
ncbi:MAG: tetratricopeptide repeat protein [Magnetococcales bacterium]|nr:tetratricopeptide repeat protein [Magnetococcales bacterium]